jgi:hypothetical protein
MLLLLICGCSGHPKAGDRYEAKGVPVFATEADAGRALDLAEAKAESGFRGLDYAFPMGGAILVRERKGGLVRVVVAGGRSDGVIGWALAAHLAERRPRPGSAPRPPNLVESR